MFKILKLLCCFIIISTCTYGQRFDHVTNEKLKKLRPIDEPYPLYQKKHELREMIMTAKGEILISTSSGIARINVDQLTIDYHTKALKINGPHEIYTGYKLMAIGPGDIIYAVTDNKRLGYIDYNKGKEFNSPPFDIGNNIDIERIWIDKEGDLFIASVDSLYIVEDATRISDSSMQKNFFSPELDNDSNVVVTKGTKKIEKFSLGNNVLPYCFAEDLIRDKTYIGTNQGIYEFDKSSGNSSNLFMDYKQNHVTVTHIELSKFFSDIWFSTLENGMGNYNLHSKEIVYYSYKKEFGTKNPIVNFTRLSDKEFLIATVDSLPAIFNTETFSYRFINDTSFSNTKNRTTAAQYSPGKLTAVIKGGDLFISRDFPKGVSTKDSTYYIGPYIKEILVQGKPYKQKINYYDSYVSLNEIHLKYYENNFDIEYAPMGITSSENIVFAWKLEGSRNEWAEVPFTIMDESENIIHFNNLKPDKYIFRIRIKKDKNHWLKEEVELTIIIEPPFWQTSWFWTFVIAGLSLIIFLIIKVRVNTVRKQERLKAKHEKELLELESKALRAQMNPHFVFNCLNSIKALIQDNEKQKATDYLTSFSKLIRTLFQNSDKRQISLFDEVETCRLYTQLEAMRLKGKLNYNFIIDANVDLKSVMVPALIIQPFIENAIWHGIVPKEEGTINVTINQKEDAIVCEVDDDGIGRELSKLNKPITRVIHESKGVHLSQARIDLEKKLNESQASIKIIDKYENNKATGTRVVLTFNLN